MVSYDQKGIIFCISSFNLFQFQRQDNVRFVIIRTFYEVFAFKMKNFEFEPHSLAKNFTRYQVG